MKNFYVKKSKRWYSKYGTALSREKLMMIKCFLLVFLNGLLLHVTINKSIFLLR